jgi:hypothetical protein
MEALAKLSFVVTSLVLLVLGLRLLWVWRRTRQTPELAIGLAYATGIAGLFLLVTAVRRAELGQPVMGLWIAGHVGIQAGQAALLVGIWRIFRPGSRRAAGLAAAGALLSVLAIALAASRRAPDLYTEVTPLILLTTGIPMLSYGWIAAESFLYAGRLRRRLAIGLTDTLTVWRFRRWGWGGVFAWCVSPLSLFSVLVYQQGLSHVLWIFGLSQLLLVAACSNTWLAFFPPAFYVRMAQRRDAPASA